MDKAETLHVVEPTLQDETGHCLSFLESVFLARDRPFPVVFWVGRKARLRHFVASGASVRPYFHRRFRKLQAFLLYRRLLAGTGRLFLPTAGRTDLILLHWAARKPIPPGKVILYFHWLRSSPERLRSLARLARKQPQLTVLGPTETVAKILRDCGFADARMAPYPLTLHPFPRAVPFTHVLYAGAARQDKGIAAVVDFVAHLAASGSNLPVIVQTSPDHQHRYDSKTADDLARLERIGYPRLTIRPETLSKEDYAALYAGAVCLQPYRRQDFSDRVSGITLDALSLGAPVITTAGTWMGRLVERYGAGLAVKDFSPASLQAAVETVRKLYEVYASRACEGGAALRMENSGQHLMDIFTEKPGSSPASAGGQRGLAAHPPG
jgi:glycosyltransferase involved in cell wall biosynthesis